MGRVKYLLGLLILAACVSESLSDNSVQKFTSYAKTCNDCNSTDAECNSKSGYVLCSCPAGQVGDGLNCTRLVFCDSSPCCPQGYKWDNAGKQCVDINECASETTNACVGKAYCINKNGIYLCNNPNNMSCPTSSCGSDKDCVKTVNSDGSVTLNCIDPCEQYQEIDGSKRLFTINSIGRFPTDRNLFGWCRYKNGLRMKEGCVDYLKCGSLEPLSLSKHPTLSDGIKSVSLINNALTGCITGSSIKVKACPGGYYVYKFSGLLKFDVYCTELQPLPTTTPTTTTTTTTTTEPPTSTTTTTTEPPTSTTTTTREPPTSTTTTTTQSTNSNTTTTTEPQTSTTTTTPQPTNSNTTTTTEPQTSTTTTTPQPTSSTTTTTPQPTSSTTTTTPQPTSSSTTTTTQPTTHTTITTTNPTTGITTPTSMSTKSTPIITTQTPVLSSTHSYIEDNVTVTTVRSRSVLIVRVLSQVIDNKEVKSLQINETTTVDIEMKTISLSTIHIKNTTSISPTSILIIVGGTETESLSNHTDTTITTSEITVPNTEHLALDSYCSKPAQTNTVTETSAVAGNTCSMFTSASTTTTITTTEEVIVLGPDGFSKSCSYF